MSDAERRPTWQATHPERHRANQRLWAARVRNYRYGPLEVECRQCHGPMVATEIKSHYCSLNCRRLAANQRASGRPRRASRDRPRARVWYGPLEVECRQCHGPMVARALRQHYCSDRCGHRADRLRHPRRYDRAQYLARLDYVRAYYVANRERLCATGRAYRARTDYLDVDRMRINLNTMPPEAKELGLLLKQARKVIRQTQRRGTPNGSDNSYQDNA